MSENRRGNFFDSHCMGQFSSVHGQLPGLRAGVDLVWSPLDPPMYAPKQANLSSPLCNQATATHYYDNVRRRICFLRQFPSTKLL